MIFDITEDLAKNPNTPKEEFPQSFIDAVEHFRGRGYNDHNIAMFTGALKVNIDKI